MSKEIEQLIDMGATPAQAREAMRRCKDVMDAAEKIFSGELDDVTDDVEMAEPTSSRSSVPKSQKLATPEADDDEDGQGSDDEVLEEADDDDDEDVGFQDYDSDYDLTTKSGTNEAKTAIDPYAGIFFSKSRREEVIEVEEEPEFVRVVGQDGLLPLMTQGEWMKGCPEGGEQGFLFSLYSQLSEPVCKCPNECIGQVLRNKSEFFAIYPDFSTYINHLRSTVVKQCSKCSREICTACGELVTDKVNRAPHLGPYDPLFHCSDLQGVILGVGLFMLERMFADQSLGTQTGTVDSERAARKRKVDITSNTPDDDEYHSAAGQRKKVKSGIGYDGAVKEDQSGQNAAKEKQVLRDVVMSELMKQVRVFLPSLQRESGNQTSDFMVHPTALAHLRRRFNFVSSSLLRNDSLTDMSDRSILYFELFSWLETVSNHEALASMVAMPIMVQVSVKPAVPKPGATKRRTRERVIVYEGSAGPRELIQSLVIQATAALKGLDGMRTQEDEEEMTEAQKRVTTETRVDKGKAKEKNPVAEENMKLLKFCDRILSTASAIDRSLRETKGDAFVDRMSASLPKITSSKPTDEEKISAPALSTESTEAETMKMYEEWANAVRFEYCDLTISPSAISTAVTAARARINAQSDGENQPASDDVPHYKHAYNHEARMLTHSDIPKRSLAIAKELAVLTTNLPVAWNSSIFLKVDETRVDIIKALITGPEGTPYYNGCYCFDIFLGASYNSAPPNVKYMTTNNGKFRFNPNLYAEGKVCLSLLGTWAGPGWVAGRSTLLQVLISIQSMILCEEPYLNEPSWAQSTGTPASHAYSANVRRMVVHTAMLGNLKNPPEPWKDIIRTHFRLKAKSVSEQLDKWLQTDDGRPTQGQGGGHVTSASQNVPGGSNNGFKKDVEEMKRHLHRLSIGEEIETDPNFTPASAPGDGEPTFEAEYDPDF